jgi:hypothetical protein
VAASLREHLGVTATLESGGRGEFSVWVGDERVISKTIDGFPDEAAVVQAVRARRAADG